MRLPLANFFCLATSFLMASQHAPTYNFPSTCLPTTPILWEYQDYLSPKWPVSPSIKHLAPCLMMSSSCATIIRPLIIDNLVKDFNLDAPIGQTSGFLKVVVYIVRYTLSSHTDFVFVRQLGSIGMGYVTGWPCHQTLHARSHVRGWGWKMPLYSNGVRNLSVYTQTSIRTRGHVHAQFGAKVCPHMSHFGLCGCWLMIVEVEHSYLSTNGFPYFNASWFEVCSPFHVTVRDLLFDGEHDRKPFNGPGSMNMANMIKSRHGEKILMSMVKRDRV